MLAESRLYSFLDNHNGFTLHFLEGQKIIHDLVLTSNYQKAGFSFFRDTVLTSLQLLNYLKAGENLGFYIDSNNPKFSFKIEINNQGTFRTLLLPKNFSSSPNLISGTIKLSKIAQGAKTPYSSITEFQNANSLKIFNDFMQTSYQTKCQVVLSDTSDQSLMIAKLPPEQVDREVIKEDLSLQDYTNLKLSRINQIFQSGHHDLEKIVKDFEDLGLIYLQSKELKFFCPCNKQQFTVHLSALPQIDQDEIFQDGHAQIMCDYCNKEYIIERSDLQMPQ